MIGEGIFRDLKKLYEHENITKKELLDILKDYAKLISVYDLMAASGILRSSMEYVQEKYQDQFAEPYVKTFIIGLNSLSNHDGDVEGFADRELFKDSLDNLEYNFFKEVDDIRKKSNFSLIVTVTSLYATFIEEQPLHPVGSVFPGSFEVYEENGVFYCPVKDAQKDNPDALCKFCLAEQTPNVH